MDPARNDIVSGSFRSRFDEDRSLYFSEPVLVKIVSADFDYFVPERKIALHLALAQIEISVLESEILIDIIIVPDIDRRSFRLGIYHKVIGKNFDISCRDI